MKSNLRGLDERYNASQACCQMHYDLSAFTLSLQDPDFIHQLAVDAYAAQHSGPNVKPIATAFGLIGLFFTFERGYTGREVQKAHMALGNQHLQGPHFNPPLNKKSLTVMDVWQGITDKNYREKITRWGKSVWNTWSSEHARVRQMIEIDLKVQAD